MKMPSLPDVGPSWTGLPPDFPHPPFDRAGQINQDAERMEQELIAEAKRHTGVDEPRVFRIYGWQVVHLHFKRLFGRRVDLHPDGDDCARHNVFTSRLVYLNRDTKVAVTRNTVYLLMGPEVRP